MCEFRVTVVCGELDFVDGDGDTQYAQPMVLRESGHRARMTNGLRGNGDATGRWYLVDARGDTVLRALQGRLQVVGAISTELNI